MRRRALVAVCDAIVLTVVLYGAVVFILAASWVLDGPGLPTTISYRWILLGSAAVSGTALWCWLYADSILQRLRAGRQSPWGLALLFVPFTAIAYYVLELRPRLGQGGAQR